jgi:hypothetical protein
MIIITFSIVLLLLPLVHSIFDKPISVSCSSTFDPSNWTHHAFILQTVVMIVIVCIGLCYLYRRYGFKCRSHYRTSRSNFNTPPSYAVSPPYGQVPVPSAGHPMALYALFPPTAPPTTTTNPVSLATPSNIVT